MLMRKLGRTGLKVSALCLGGNTFGWTTDQKASEAVLDAYLEAGGNFIDTADVYSRWAPGNKGGESEHALGIWMTERKNRHAVLIATKVMGPMGPGPNDTGLSRQHIAEGVEASLKRLQTDYIDLYQAHWDDRDTPLEETLRAFDDLVSQGKVRYIGCSNYHAWRLTRALWESDKHGYARYESLQPKYNLVFRDEYERELEPLCLEQGVGVIPYSSLGSGFLLLLARERIPLRQVPPGRGAAQDGARRQRAEGLHDRSRLRGLGRSGQGRRQGRRDARSGFPLLARAPPRHHRAHRQRHLGRPAQGADGRHRPQAGRGGDGRARQRQRLEGRLAEGRVRTPAVAYTVCSVCRREAPWPATVGGGDPCWSRASASEMTTSWPAAAGWP